MYPDVLCDDKMTWQKSELPLVETANLHNGIYLNGDVDKSQQGSILNNHIDETPTNEKASKSSFLQKLSYFEAKGPIKNLSIRKTLQEVRTQFLNGNEDVFSDRRLSPVKLNFDSVNIQKRNSLTEQKNAENSNQPQLVKVQTNEDKSIRNLDKRESEPTKHLSVKETLNEVRAHFPKEDLDVLVGRRVSPVKLHATNSNPQSPTEHKYISDVKIERNEDKGLQKFEPIESEPTRKLSVKKTITDVRAQFTNENSESEPDYLQTNCAQFFFTHDDQFLLNETNVATKQFKLLLRGHMYKNVFSSLEHISHNTQYYLHDFFDHDLSTLDLFEPEII